MTILIIKADYLFMIIMIYVWLMCVVETKLMKWEIGQICLIYMFDVIDKWSLTNYMYMHFHRMFCGWIMLDFCLQKTCMGNSIHDPYM